MEKKDYRVGDFFSVKIPNEYDFIGRITQVDYKTVHYEVIKGLHINDEGFFFDYGTTWDIRFVTIIEMDSRTAKVLYGDKTKT